MRGLVTHIGGGVLLKECLAVFGQSVSDRSATAFPNKGIDAIVQFAGEFGVRICN